MIKGKDLWGCVYKAGYYTVYHDGIEHAGYLAFLGLLSLFPFLVFFVAIAGLIGEMQITTEFAKEVIGILPDYMIVALKPRIDEIVSGPPQGLMTLAIIGVIWTASSAVEGTRTILNRAYRVKTPPAYIWRRLLSIAQFFILTVGIIIGMFILIFAPIIWHSVNEILKIQDYRIEQFAIYIRYGMSFAILFIVVSFSYYILPNIKQTLFAVVPGTLIVLAMWMAAAELFSSYLRNFEQVNLVYGSLGGIIVALLFFYILGVIYIFGAEFNYFFEKAIGYNFEQKEEVSINSSSQEDD